MQVDGMPPRWLIPLKPCQLHRALAAEHPHCTLAQNCSSEEKQNKERPVEADAYFKEELESLFTVPDGRVWGAGEGDLWLFPAGGL